MKMIDGKPAEKSKFAAIVDRISRGLVYVTFGTILLLLLTYTVDGVYRYISGRSIFGLMDVVEFSLVLTIFLGIAYVASIKGHINVTLATDKYQGRAKPVVNAVATLLGIIYIALMTWQLGARGWKQIMDPTLTTSSLQWPIGPFLLIMALGCFVLLLVLITDLFSDISGAFVKKPANKS
ncbi:MAG: hypothetical protein A2Z02_02710 [Chloroflexi bacterium RBG_16_48_7]|nr:MAG: hypothetical protein A2Z02_02710 [Chloroflexi bacterium RBG_16_48_7]